MEGISLKKTQPKNQGLLSTHGLWHMLAILTAWSTEAEELLKALPEQQGKFETSMDNLGRQSYNKTKRNVWGYR